MWRIYPTIYLPNWKVEYGYPILMHLSNLVSNWSVASRIKPHVIQRNLTQAISDSISQDILSQIFNFIQSDVALQNQVY